MTEENHQPEHKEKKGHLEKNKKLFANKSLLQDEWMKCLSKPDVCLFSFFCGCCVMGTNWMMSGGEDGKILHCILAFFCSCCLCAIIRSNGQQAMGVDDDGCLWNCLMHFTCLLSPCSATQSFKGLVRWKKATDEKFKERYKKDGKMYWNVALGMF